MDDEDEITSIEMVEDMMVELEDIVLDFDRRGDEITSQLDFLLSGAAPREIADDELLTLARAVCLPVLGGRMLMSPEMSIPSPHISVKTLRSAIDSGALACHRPNKNIYVTPKLIKEWIASCENRTPTPISCKEKLDTRTGSSPTKVTGTSSTDRSRFRQDALSQMIKKLK